MKNKIVFLGKLRNQMCSIANPGEIKVLFLLLHPGENFHLYLIRSNLPHRVLLCIPAGGGGAASGALWPDVDSKGGQFLHFPYSSLCFCSPCSRDHQPQGALETCLEMAGNQFSCEVPGTALLV